MASSLLPIGAPMVLPITQEQVQIAEGNKSAPVYSEDAVAVLVWNNYQRAKNFVENNGCLLDWQETDILYQSPIPNRFNRVEQGRPARVPRFLVAKFARTMARAVKRGLFSDQIPFFLRPQGKTTQKSVDAWTSLLMVLLKRANFIYHAGLQINCQVLQGTGPAKWGWEEREIKKKTRKRKKPPATVGLPTGPVEVPTVESDEFEPKTETVTESWPFFEYRRLGTTLYDPKWCTPDAPEESAHYCIDIDYVTFEDLQDMRQMSCYQESANNPGIPDEAALKEYFFGTQGQSAPEGSSVESAMTAQGSAAAHAEGRERSTSVSPLDQPIMLLAQWDQRTIKEILVCNDRKLPIRNEEHDYDSMCHPTCTWWPIDNSGYGMGIGKINGSDQRINQGVLNECLKMIAYPLNAPIVIRRGENAPTQNVINRLGGFWQVDALPNEDVRKAAAFMDMPQIPADAWRMLELSQRGGEELSGADAQTQRGVSTGKQGIGRSSFGAQRLANMSDQDVADPVDSFANGVLIPFLKFLVHMVKTKMPIAEIRCILKPEYAELIEQAIEFDQLLDADFEIQVLAGQKLAAKAGIQQLIPFFLQIVQQPQLLEYLHQRGETVDFEVIMDLMLQVSELTQQPDIFRKLTPQEQAMVQQMNPGVQKIQGDVVKEKVKGQEESRHIHEQGEVDLGNKAAEIAMQHLSDGSPLVHAVGLSERSEDKNILEHGMEDFTA